MSYRPQAAYQRYRDTQVMTADPLQLVIMVYDLAIAGCNERNLEKVTRGLSELRDSLNHEDGGQLAANLLSIYVYLADQAREGNYEHVALMLKELRDTWAIAREQVLQQSGSIEAYSVAA